jgi:site-specific DNA-cytosine methylase
MSKKTKTTKKQLIIENDSKIYNAVSLFSGLGGDSLGMTQAGCKLIGYNELNLNFCKSHDANFKDCELVY